LQDLQSLGQINGFLWFGQADLSQVGEAPEDSGLIGQAWWVEGGKRRFVPRVDLWLAQQNGSVMYRRCRLLVISLVEPTGQLGGGGKDLSRWAGLLRRRLTNTLKLAHEPEAVAGCHLLVADRESAQQAPLAGGDEVVWPGWANLLVEPVDYQGPGQDGQPVAGAEWSPPPDAAVSGRRAAAVIASLLGLWPGSRPAVLPPDSSLHTVRSFHRCIDARRLEYDLRRRVLDTKRLPEPRAIERGVEYREAPDAITARAEDLFNNYPDVFLDQEDEPEPDTPWRTVTLGERLRAFISFLWRALCGLPRNLWQNLRAGFYARLAATAQQLLEGEGSRRVITVGGVLPDGTPARWWDFQGDGTRKIWLERAQFRSRSFPVTGPPPKTEEQLWRDLEAAAWSLADGRARGFAPAPGLTRPVVTDREAIAPAPESGFNLPDPWCRSLDDEEGEGIGITRVAPGDFLLAQDAITRLRERDGGNSTAEAIEAWWLDQQASFTGRIGEKLGQRLLDLEKKLQHDKSDDDDSTTVNTLQAMARRCAALLRGLTFSLLGLVGVVAVITKAPPGFPGLPFPWPYLDTIVGVAVISGMIISWFGSAFVTFTHYQAALFRLLGCQRQIDARREWRWRVRADNERRYSLVADAYGRFTCWATVLGEVLRRPFGHPESAPAAKGSGMISGLPLNIRIGTGEADAGTVSDVVFNLRYELFTEGWLDASAEALRSGFSEWTKYEVNGSSASGAEVSLGSDGCLGQADRPWFKDADAIYKLSFFEHDFALPRWANTVRLRGVPATAGDSFWGQVFPSVRATGTDRVSAAVSPGVRDAVARIPTTVSTADGADATVPDFLLGLEPGRQVEPQSADSSLSRPHHRGRAVFQSAEVVSDKVVSGSDHLSVQVTLTQFTGGFGVGDTILSKTDDLDAGQAGTGAEVEF
jgi:hypothetical protein